MDCEICIEFHRRNHHHHHRPTLRITFMTAPTLIVGTPLERTITAGYPDPSGAGDFLVDPNAVVTVTEDSAGAVLSLGTPSGTNPVTLVYTPVAPGTSNVTATSTDPDGTVITGTEAVIVEAGPPPPPDTDATEITFS